MTHREFLDLRGGDPRRVLAEQLIQDCGDSGAVYVFSASVDTGIIAKFTEQFPDLFFPLQSIRQRIVDLLPIVKQCYYHPDQNGSWSLKAIIEPMTGRTYTELEAFKWELKPELPTSSVSIPQPALSAGRNCAGRCSSIVSSILLPRFESGSS